MSWGIKRVYTLSRTPGSGLCHQRWDAGKPPPVPCSGVRLVSRLGSTKIEEVSHMAMFAARKDDPAPRPEPRVELVVEPQPPAMRTPLVAGRVSENGTPGKTTAKG